MGSCLTRLLAWGQEVSGIKPEGAADVVPDTRSPEHPRWCGVGIQFFSRTFFRIGRRPAGQQ